MIRQSFDDFDAYASAIKDAAIDFRLLHVLERSWSIEQRILGGLQLQKAYEGSAFLACGEMQPHCAAVYLQKSGQPIRVNGQTLDGNSVALLPPKSEFSFIGRGKNEWLSVAIPNRYIESQPAFLERSGQSAYVVHPSNLDIVSSLKSSIVKAFNTTNHDGKIVDNVLGEFLLERCITSLVCEVLRESTTKCVTSNLKSKSYSGIVARALDCIGDHPPIELDVSFLSEQLGVSTRTILRAFRAELDLSPHAYLINHKLHFARQALLMASQQVSTVTSIAASLGFNDFGRFASRYRDLFGELPSQTLQQDRN